MYSSIFSDILNKGFSPLLKLFLVGAIFSFTLFFSILGSSDCNVTMLLLNTTGNVVLSVSTGNTKSVFKAVGFSLINFTNDF